jgi:hypothetical protein
MSTTVLDRTMPAYDLAITEHLVVDESPDTVYRAAAGLDFMTVRTPLLLASTFVRGLPARLRGRPVTAPAVLRLADQGAGGGLPGWLMLGEDEGRELAFGAVGRFWTAEIDWHPVDADHFGEFDEPGWGKIGCHFLVREAGPGRAVVTYECRVATTDSGTRRRVARYWTLIRPFVGHIMRATLRTIAAGSLAQGASAARRNERSSARRCRSPLAVGAQPTARSASGSVAMPVTAP